MGETTRRRVVVTGLGIVSPLGINKELFFEDLCAGKSGIHEIRNLHVDGRSCRLAAELTDFNPADLLSSRNLRKMDRLSRAAVCAARLAMEDAGLRLHAGNRERAGMVLGTAFGNTALTAELAETLFREGPRYVNPFHVPNTVMNAPAGHSAIELGFRGVNLTVNHKEVSGEAALALAADAVERSEADIMFAGGADILGPFLLLSLNRFRALSPDDNGEEKARPFDVRRNGFIAGEGAGVLCLESLESASDRGRTPLAEIVGRGLGASPCSLTGQPSDPAGSTLTMERAVRFAGIDPSMVDYVSASANGGRHGDLTEAAALRFFFEGRSPLISSLKGALGESFSSGGLRAAALVQSLRTGRIPPCTGLSTPLNSLEYVLQPKHAPHLEYALLNGNASGGTHVSIVFRRWTEKSDRA